MEICCCKTAFFILEQGCVGAREGLVEIFYSNNDKDVDVGLLVNLLEKHFLVNQEYK